MTKKRGLFVLALVVLVDQISKYLVIRNALSLPIEVLPFFNLVLAWNRGISFGMFHSYNPWFFGALTLLIMAIIAGIFIYMMRQKDRCKVTFLALVVGGGIGNIIDRLWHGAVVDFLDFHLYNYHWPAFNVADSCIVVGVFSLIIFSYLYEKK